MKRKAFVILKILICCLIAAAGLAVIYERKRTIDIEHEHLNNELECNTYSVEMMNYVMENEKNITGFCNELSEDHRNNTYTDSFGRTLIKKEIYNELTAEYNMQRFNDFPNTDAYIDVISENEIHFIYDVIYFENGCYALFEFVYENGSLKIMPYVYDELYKSGY